MRTIQQADTNFALIATFAGAKSTTSLHPMRCEVVFELTDTDLPDLQRSHRSDASDVFSGPVPPDDIVNLIFDDQELDEPRRMQEGHEHQILDDSGIPELLTPQDKSQTMLLLTSEVAGGDTKTEDDGRDAGDNEAAGDAPIREAVAHTRAISTVIPVAHPVNIICSKAATVNDSKYHEESCCFHCPRYPRCSGVIDCDPLKRFQPHSSYSGPVQWCRHLSRRLDDSLQDLRLMCKKTDLATAYIGVLGPTYAAPEALMRMRCSIPPAQVEKSNGPLPADVYPMKCVPKLEDFISEKCFPDILMVHDPDHITNTGQYIKYKRIYPMLIRDFESRNPAGSHNGDADRVAHLHLSANNRLGSGHHSHVHRALLILSSDLHNRVTVAAKTAFRKCGAHKLLNNEAWIYNSFPKAAHGGVDQTSRQHIFGYHESLGRDRAQIFWFISPGHG
ncbi:hypothetical protein A0H81_14780 [Grifola frondosa]|uniref:Uncharacterized protein n=1 Tax=Grifola frondosa TaxID=5627 RepID=A0A1C7LKJ1_GRIFR|nr:hypothetical protein A0H81_14780 [Grifola frondosa]